MAPAVVEQLEIVQVQHDQTMFGSGQALVQQFRHPADHCAPVQQPGQRIQFNKAAQLHVFFLLRINVLDQDKSLDVLGEGVRNELNAGHHPEETAVGIETPVFEMYFTPAAVVFSEQLFPVKDAQILRQISLVDIMA